MSLKQRIAMLQEQQKLQQERDRELAQRKLDKKTKHERHEVAVVQDSPDNVSESTGGTTEEPSGIAAAPLPVSSAEESDGQNADTARAEGKSHETVQRSEDSNVVGEEVAGEKEEQSESEDSEDKADDEETRRAALRERMARLAGAGRMGMPGSFNPFGIPMPSGKAPQKTAHKDTEDQKVADIPRAIPVLPFADPNALPHFQKHTTGDNDDTSGSRPKDDGNELPAAVEGKAEAEIGKKEAVATVKPVKGAHEYSKLAAPSLPLDTPGMEADGEEEAEETTDNYFGKDLEPAIASSNRSSTASIDAVSYTHLDVYKRQV